MGRKNKEFSRYNGFDWQALLQHHPEFADRCDWEKLSGTNWFYLLDCQPQLSEHCDWSKLSSEEWTNLLSSHPEFADKCDWRRLKGCSLMKILVSQPQLAEYCSLETLKSWNFAALLSWQPQFADLCDFSQFDGDDWAALLVRQPQFADKCDWSTLDGYNWSSLLAEQPQFADRCNWNSFCDDDWRYLTSRQSRFDEQEKKFYSRSGKLAKKQLSGSEWLELLIWRPECYANSCEWSRLSPENWSWLLSQEPAFRSRFDWKYLREYRKKCSEPVFSSELLFFLCRFPEFIRSCDLLDGRTWSALLSLRPEAAEFCDFGKLDGHDWAALVASQPGFAERCDFGKLDGRDWKNLLVLAPFFRSLYEKFKPGPASGVEKGARCWFYRCGDAVSYSKGAFDKLAATICAESWRYGSPLSSSPLFIREDEDGAVVNIALFYDWDTEFRSFCYVNGMLLPEDGELPCSVAKSVKKLLRNSTRKAESRGDCLSVSAGLCIVCGIETAEGSSAGPEKIARMIECGWEKQYCGFNNLPVSASYYGVKSLSQER